MAARSFSSRVVVEAFQPELLGKAVLGADEQPGSGARDRPRTVLQIVNLVWQKEPGREESPCGVGPVKKMGQETHIPLDKYAAFIQHGSAVCCHKRVPANRQPPGPSENPALDKRRQSHRFSGRAAPHGRNG